MGNQKLRLGAIGVGRNAVEASFDTEDVRPEIGLVIRDNSGNEAEFRIEKGGPLIA